MKSLTSEVSRQENSGNNEFFTRYKIETIETPHRFSIPHPFIPKVKKLGLAKLLINEVFEYNFKLIKKEYRQTLLSRPCIYGVFSGFFGGFKPIEELCVGCMRCVQEYPETCTVVHNPEFSDFGDSYWMPEDQTNIPETQFATIWYEAKTGKIPVKGMGYRGTFTGPGWDSMWTDMSEIVRPTRDGVYGREYISTRVDIGSRLGRIDFNNLNKEQPSFTIPIPILFDYLPSNLNHPSITKSISMSAKELSTKFITTPELIDKYNLSITNNMILYITSEEAIEIENYINNVSGIEIDPDCLHLVEKIRSFNQNIPILVRVKISEDIYSEIIGWISRGIDGIHLEADYHGKTYDKDQKFIKTSLIDIHKKLVRAGVRDKITLLVSGGITLAEHVPKAIICGADAVAINSSILVALQCKFENECRFPTVSKISEVKIDSNWGKQRIVNLMASWHNQVIEIMSAMGIKEIRRLRGDTGRAMFQEELEEVAFGDIARID